MAPKSHDTVLLATTCSRAWDWTCFYRRRGDIESARRWFAIYRRALEYGR